MPIPAKMKFNFKTRAIRDEEGKEIGRSKKQPSVECELPVPSHDEVVTFLSAPESKEASLVMSAVQTLIYQAARDQFDEIIEAFGDDDSKTVAADMLDLSRLDLTYIANLPPSSRAGTALTEEDWKSFFEDYVTVMVAATGKEVDRVMKHVELFKKPTKAKANKEVLQLLVGQLDIYLANTQNAEDNSDCAVRIRDKYERWSKEPEKTVDLSLL